MRDDIEVVTTQESEHAVRDGARVPGHPARRIGAAPLRPRTGRSPGSKQPQRRMMALIGKCKLLV